MSYPGGGYIPGAPGYPPTSPTPFPAQVHLVTMIATIDPSVDCLVSL